MASSGVIARPRAFRSINSSRQLCALSRMPTDLEAGEFFAALGCRAALGGLLAIQQR